MMISERAYAVKIFVSEGILTKESTTEEAVNNKMDKMICSEDISQPVFLVT